MINSPIAQIKKHKNSIEWQTKLNCAGSRNRDSERDYLEVKKKKTKEYIDKKKHTQNSVLQHTSCIIENHVMADTTNTTGTTLLCTRHVHTCYIFQYTIYECLYK